MQVTNSSVCPYQLFTHFSHSSFNSATASSRVYPRSARICKHSATASRARFRRAAWITAVSSVTVRARGAAAYRQTILFQLGHGPLHRIGVYPRLDR